MTAKQKLTSYKLLNFIFRLIVPAIVAGIVFGLFKEAEPSSWVDKLAGGFFVVIILFFVEVKDFIQKQFEQLKLDKRVAFSKNRTFLFLGLGVFVLLVNTVADKAIPFLFISGGSCAIASIFEWLASKVYREVNPLALEVTVRG